MEYGNYSISRQGFAFFVNNLLARLGVSTDKMKALVAELDANWNATGHSFVQSALFNTSASGHVLVFAHRSAHRASHMDIPWIIFRFST